MEERLPVEKFPSVIAIPLAEYKKETASQQKLWAACHLIELILRLLVIAGVADILRHNEGLPAPLVERFRTCINQPTLDRWQRMSEAVSEFLSLSHAGTVLPELPDFVANILKPIMYGADGSASSPESSFIRLRNQLAHGGGMTEAAALRLFQIWEDRVTTVIRSGLWLCDLKLVVRASSGGHAVLRGPATIPEPYTPDAEHFEGPFRKDEVVLLRGGSTLRLWPLLLYGRPRSLDPNVPRPTQPVPQIYQRRGEDGNLQYSAIGSEEVCLSIGSEDVSRYLEVLFPRAAAARVPAFDYFEAWFRQDAERLIGRDAELIKLRHAVATATERLLWVCGPAGIGKSYLMSRLVMDLLDNQPACTMVIGYRFKISDSRCSRQSFLRFAIKKLEAWLRLPESEEENTAERLRQLFRSLGTRRVLFALDGLDEIAQEDPTFVGDVVFGLQSQAVTWVCAGRPDYGLAELFSGPECKAVFPDGVPPMNAGDIRSLLLEQIEHPHRRRLLMQDREVGGHVTNDFVEKVARAADGLPLYVRYVIRDICCEKIRTFDENEQLPPSLVAYFEKLFQRYCIGTLHQVVTPLVATLAVAKEPLTAGALTGLLSRRTIIPDGQRGLDLVERALARVGSITRLATMPDGVAGYALFHHSIRQHLVRSETTRDAVALAQKAMSDAALQIEADAAGPYLCRHGVKHLLETGRVCDALLALTNFSLLMTRLRVLPNPEGVNAIGEDWRSYLATNKLSGDEVLWEAFYREREHILRRGNVEWPAYKILLQLAAEHADESPVTRAALEWLRRGECDWAWLRNQRRSTKVSLDPCLRVFEGHSGSVAGAVVIDRRIISGSSDGTLRFWDLLSGNLLRTAEAHSREILGIKLISDNRLLSWSEDGELRIWNINSARMLALLRGHTWAVHGALELSDGRILSWQRNEEGTLRLWNARSGEPVGALTGHTGMVNGTVVLSDGRLVTASSDCTIRIWDPIRNTLLKTLKGHRQAVLGILELSEQKIVSWSEDRTLRIWSLESGKALKTLRGHDWEVLGARLLSDGSLLSWSLYDLGIWDLNSGKLLRTFSGHDSRIEGALEIEGRILSWSADKTVRVWDLKSGREIATLRGHTNWVAGGVLVQENQLLTWSWDSTLRLWSIQSNYVEETPSPEKRVAGILRLQNGRFVTWSSEDESKNGTLAFWDPESGNEVLTIEAHRDPVGGMIALSENRVVSWPNRAFGREGAIRIWDTRTGKLRRTLTGHSRAVNGARLIEHNRLLSWSDDKTLRIWNITNGALLTTLRGHAHPPQDVYLLQDGRIVSWSRWEEDGDIYLWNIGDRISHTVLRGHTDLVNGVLTLPDVKLLSWADDNTLRMWDLHNSHNPRSLLTFEGHTDAVAGAFPIQDGQILSWSWRDGTIRLWDASSGKLLITIQTNGVDLHAVSLLSADRAVSWSEDGMVQLWNLETGVCLERLSELEAAQLRPNWLVAHSEPLSQGLFVGWSYERTVGISRLPAGYVAVWQSNSSARAHYLLADGTFVVSSDEGGLSFLKLHLAGRRVLLSEL